VYKKQQINHYYNNKAAHRTDLSSVLSQFTRLTDRQTDRRTDSFLIISPRWHYMQRGKKYRWYYW